jgi:hypothetical protein
MRPDDPKLTAYALGELPKDERRLIERELATSPELQAHVSTTQQLAEQLEREFRLDLDQQERPRANILPMPYGRVFWSGQAWPVFAIAAAVIAAVSVVTVLFWRSNPLSSSRSVAGQSATQQASDVMVEYGPSEDTAAAQEETGAKERAFTRASVNPVSIFPMQLGSGSFAEVRKAIEEGRRPAKSGVRIEELINHFSYTYAEPAPTELAAIELDAASCPWRDGHKLARIGINARNADAARVVEVRFNGSAVESYRLLGYEGAASGSDATARERNARTTVTAFYEIVLLPSASAAGVAPKAQLLEARLRRSANSSEALAERTLRGDVVQFEQASEDFRFAAAIAEFAILLRDSPYKGSADFGKVIAWADGAKGTDQERANFVQLIRQCRSLL